VATKSGTALVDGGGLFGFGEEGLVVGQGVDGAEDDVAAFAFCDIAAGARGLGHINQIRAFMHREKQDGSTGGDLSDFARGGKAVDDRHSDIEDDDVRAEGLGLLNRFATVYGFAADLDTGARAKNGANAHAHGFMIVNY
jgi:hypothetical protein